jgi:hypothetical protein
VTRTLRFKDEAELKEFKARMPSKRAALLEPPAEPPKRNKFGAVKVEYDGIEFASKREGARYLLLKQRMAVNEIADLHCQFPIDCEVNGVLVTVYIVDFAYKETATGRSVYEDTKGYRRGSAWAVFRLKVKLVEALHGIKVEAI